MTDIDPDQSTSIAAGDHPDSRSPEVDPPRGGTATDVEGARDPEPDEEREAGDGSGPDVGAPIEDPESPGQTIDDPEIAEPNEPG